MSLKPRGRGYARRFFYVQKASQTLWQGQFFFERFQGGSPDAGDRRGWTPDTGQKSDHQRQHENRHKSTVLILRNLIWATHFRQLSCALPLRRARATGGAGIRGCIALPNLITSFFVKLGRARHRTVPSEWTPCLGTQSRGYPVSRGTLDLSFQFHLKMKQSISLR